MKCCEVAFLWEEMLLATRVGDSVSSLSTVRRIADITEKNYFVGSLAYLVTS